MRRIAGSIAVVVAVLLALSGAAHGQSYQTPSIGGSDTTPDAGQTITITGSGCAPGDAVVFLFDDDAAGGTTADGSGAFTGSLTIPSNATAGVHTIKAT